MSTGREQSKGRDLLELANDNTAVVGVLGLGYVGLPLAVEAARSGFRTIGFDVSPAVVARIASGESHIGDVSSAVVKALVGEGLLEVTTDMARLAECDLISICVPTPLSKTKDPDLTCVLAAAETIAAALRPQQLIILESTTFPGTTRDVLLPILERSGLRAGEDFFVCFSPERVDPGNTVWTTKNTPKVLGGVSDGCLAVGRAFYARIFDEIVPVESVEAAELVKVYENTFRMINIALVNELAQVCDRLRVNVWDVLDAAGTKPFGFMKFQPGPGLGGHCIPLDPHYLAWKMRTLQFKTRMIELASEINAEMPRFVIGKAADALNQIGFALSGSCILVVGVAYKKDVDDLRESPALDLIRILQEHDADVAFHDPHCDMIRDDGHTEIRDLPMHSLPLTADVLRNADLVLIATDHSSVDYQFIANHASLVLDTRGTMRGIRGRARIVGLSGGIEHSGERRTRPRSWSDLGSAEAVAGTVA